jgi:hypothetical protein
MMASRVSLSPFRTLEHFTSEVESLAKRLTVEEPEELRALRTGIVSLVIGLSRDLSEN